MQMLAILNFTSLDWLTDWLTELETSHRKTAAVSTVFSRTHFWLNLNTSKKGGDDRLYNKEIVAVISMDLSKAFDTIPHALLLAKLKAYGLHESSCALIGDYLTDRRQRVKIGDTYSDWMSVKRGNASRQRPGAHVFQHVPQRPHLSH